MASDDSQPLVSIICFCKNRVKLITRCIESVINQTYRNIEFVIQDGASTDGTLELLQDYARREPRIKIVSEPDSGHEEAFWKVLHRCQGEFIGTCLSDEELLPKAVANAVERFRRAPAVGALTGDGHTIDEHGKITGNFDAGEFALITYFFSNYCPFWPGTFFRRRALIDIGLDRPDWNLGCLEFQIWCRLGTDHVVKHVAERVSNYTVHPGQLSNTPRNFHVHIDNRLKVIEHMFSADGFFGIDEVMKLECMINQISLFENHTRAYHMTEELAAFAERIRELRRQIKSIEKGRRISAGLSPISRERHMRILGSILAIWGRIARTIPASVRRRIPLTIKLAAYHAFVSSLSAVVQSPSYARWFVLMLFTRRSWEEPLPLEEPPSYTRYYPRIAAIYDARGQIEQALESWRYAEPLQNPTVDALACQAVLKLPDATYASIAALQRQWAKRHAQPAARQTPSFRPLDGKRRIRIGYHCSFMNSDTISAIMRNAFAAHDRSKFEIFGYAPSRGVSFKNAFDVLRDTEHMPDGKFLDLVRRDGIDVFVELSGFSPGHRFGAMASRCAPIQVSCLNHLGTTCVPNVDYVLSDELCTPADFGRSRAFLGKDLQPSRLLALLRLYRHGISASRGSAVAERCGGDVRLLRQRQQDQLGRNRDVGGVAETRAALEDFS